MAEDTGGARIGNVLYPVGDVAEAVRFYEQAFGIERRFVDGDRYAALDAGGVTLAIAGAEERVSETPVASFKVADVRAALEHVVAQGGEVVRRPEQGPHEVRAVARDPWRNHFVVYGPS